MCRASVPASVGVLLALAVTARAEEPLLQFRGNSWERGLTAYRREALLTNDRPETRPDVTSSPERHLSAVGELTSAASPLVWSPQAFSVSWHLDDLQLLEERRVGTTRAASYIGGRITFYTDAPSATPVYGIYPPNDTVPAQFVDGYSVYLDARIADFELAFDESSGLGSVRASVTFVGGDALPLLSSASGWELVGALRRGGPTGYAFQLSADLSRSADATGVEAETWSSIKSRYRASGLGE